MAERQVTFLEIPEQGKPVQFVMNGRTATSSILLNVEQFQQGWFRVQTQSGNRYVGVVQQPAAQTTTYNAAPTPTPTVQQTPPSNTKSGGIAGGVGGGAVGGCVGASMGIWFIIIGIVLCCTGIGIIIGLPLILAGIIIPFAGGAIGAGMGSGSLKGECPYCAMKITADLTSVTNGGMDCPSCKNRILIRNKQFVRSEDVIK